MRKHHLKVYTFILALLMVFPAAISTYGQTTKPSGMSLPEFIKGMGLSKDKLEKTMNLTRDFLTQLQEANLELTNLMSPPISNSTLDPKAKEKIAQLKQRFGLKMNKYHADLESTIGQAKALQVADKIHKIIPQVLIEGMNMPGISRSDKTAKETPTPQTAKVNTIVKNTAGVNTKIANNTPVTTNTTTFTNKAANNIPITTDKTTAANKADTTITATTNNGPQEIPLGNSLNDPNSSSSNLDLQIVGNSNSSSNNGKGMDGMDGMMGMMGMMGGMMGNMGNMGNMNNNQSMNGMELINRQLVIQLLSTNAMIVQMLAALSNQAGNGNLSNQLQPIYQILANQASLVQMLYSNLNTGTTITGQSGVGNSGNNSGSKMGM